MDPIPKSEYNYANKIVLITFKALEEVMGKNGLNAILNLAQIEQLRPFLDIITQNYLKIPKIKSVKQFVPKRTKCATLIVTKQINKKDYVRSVIIIRLIMEKLTVQPVL